HHRRQPGGDDGERGGDRDAGRGDAARVADPAPGRTRPCTDRPQRLPRPAGPVARDRFTPAMADVWAVADLAISRSGASSCAELTACGVPSLLMPYPYHKDMHQRVNAEQLADTGAAVL